MSHTHTRIRRYLYVVLGTACPLFAAASAHAQTTAPTTQALQPAESQPDAAPRIPVTTFHFQGNTAFKDAALLETLQPFLDQHLLSDHDLEEARLAITRKYVNAGYVNSGALFPDEPYDPATGTITFKIIEGQLTALHIEGNHWLRNDFIADRIRAATGMPLNSDRLKDQLELLQLNPNIRKVNAELRPGALPGESALNLSVEDVQPFWAALLLDNKRSPAVGSERFTLLAGDRNLTGHSDALSLHYGLNRGGFEEMQFADASDLGIDYTLPLTPQDTTLTLSYSRNDDVVIEAPFDSLNIGSRTDNLSISLRHPLLHTATTEFALAAALVYRDNQTTLLGQPFSFGPGAENGRTRTTILRLTQEYTQRSRTSLFAARSIFSIGLDALGANTHGAENIDSQFLAWQGQLQYVQMIPGTQALLISRGSVQVADDGLPSIEQASIGGFDTVRGYRENRLVRDNGLVGSLELRVPVLVQGGQSLLDLALFSDTGYGWNTRNPRTPATLVSVGAGLLVHPDRHIDLQVYYGYPFTRFNDPHKDLQDLGLHFALVLQAP